MLQAVHDAETSNGSDRVAGQPLLHQILRDGARQLLAVWALGVARREAGVDGGSDGYGVVAS